MADTKLSALAELAAAPAGDDELYIRDVSEAAAAESKRITVNNLLAEAGGAVTREGGNTTEATTTSTSAVDLLTASSLAIAALQPFSAVVAIRKTTGAASDASIGWMFNATEIRSPIVWSDSGNANRAGFAMIYSPPRLTNYTMGGYYVYGRDNVVPILGNLTTAAAPTVEITDLILRAQVGNGALTAAADELHVYSYAVS